jgi:hypothetical protein
MFPSLLAHFIALSTVNAAASDSVITFPAAGKLWLCAWLWKDDPVKPVDFIKKYTFLFAYSRLGSNLGALYMQDTLLPGM